eukprot:6123807-Pyramimonas_sp.AAC.1
MSQLFLRRALERFRLPPSYYNMLDGLAHDTLGHARVGENVKPLFSYHVRRPPRVPTVRESLGAWFRSLGALSGHGVSVGA